MGKGGGGGEEFAICAWRELQITLENCTLVNKDKRNTCLIFVGDSRNVCAPKFFPVAPAVVSCEPSTSKPEETEPTTRMSRRVRGLAADVNVQLGW